VTANHPRPDSMSQAKFPSATEYAVIGLLCGAAVLAPIALGGATVWARFALEAVAAVVVVLWTCTGRRSWQYTLLPLMISALTIIQLLPLPDNVLVTLAPVSAGAWKVANQLRPVTWGTISVDPAATAAGARRLLLGLSMAFVVADLARYLVHRRRLIAAISVSSVVMCLIAAIFPVTKDQVMLGFVSLKGDVHFSRTAVILPMASSGVGYPTPVDAGGRTYMGVDCQVGNGMGPYIYSNHFAGALCLTLPVAIAAGLFISRGRVPDIVRHAGGAVIFVGGLWTIAAVAQSRAGAGAMVLAGLVLLMLTVARPWAKRLAEVATLGCVGALLCLMILMYGPFDNVDESIFGKLPKPLANMLQGGREVPTRVAFRMFRASPLLGTGLDTYSDIFPRFEGGNVTLFFAHNDYAQLLAETGAVGGCIAAFLAGCLLVRGHRFYTNIPPAARLLEAGPWAGVAGIAAHSAFDWNLHLPANAFLASLVAGIAAATGMIKKPLGSSAVPAPAKPVFTTRSTPAMAGVLPRATLAAACVGSLALLARDAVCETTQRQLREAVVASRLADKDSQQLRDDQALASAITAGERMAAWDPANSQLPLLLGQAYLHFSNRPQPIDEANLKRAAAEKWFELARKRCATCRALLK
jgi:hypothetical protein